MTLSFTETERDLARDVLAAAINHAVAVNKPFMDTPFSELIDEGAKVVHDAMPKVGPKGRQVVVEGGINRRQLASGHFRVKSTRNFLGVLPGKVLETVDLQRLIGQGVEVSVR